MISSIDITGVKYEVDETTRKYVQKKIGRLDRYLPKHARKSVSADVKLKEVGRDHGNKYEAEIILNVPDKRLTAKDSTVNMLAAVDIVEAKLVAQLKKYKELHIAHVGRRGVLSRFKRSYAREL
jgi:putative sigma-54 modulation protein